MCNFCLYQSPQYYFPFSPLSSLTLTKPLGASVPMNTWLQESSTNRSEMNLTGVAFTSCRLTHTDTQTDEKHTEIREIVKRDTFILRTSSWQHFVVVSHPIT